MFSGDGEMKNQESGVKLQRRENSFQAKHEKEAMSTWYDHLLRRKDRQKGKMGKKEKKREYGVYTPYCRYSSVLSAYFSHTLSLLS